MDNRRFEAAQRSREWFHGLRLLPGAWTVVRVDGRSFSRFTESRFTKPFDERFSGYMTATAAAVTRELDGCYGFTESDEISVLLPPRWDLFDRSVEKLVSISAGVASAAFTHACGEPAHFDSRVWLGAGLGDVLDYFSWRQADAARCALNGWCYWTLRSAGQTARAATAALDGLSTQDKNELLYRHGVNFNDLPSWQRRGVGLWWDTYVKPGVDRRTGQPVEAHRRRLHEERELPMKDDYRALVARLAGAAAEPA